jgi:GxxExxY protein
MDLSRDEKIKSVDRLLPVHSAQLITYLRLGSYPVGLLINFNVTALRHGIKRVFSPLGTS